MLSKETLSNLSTAQMNIVKGGTGFTLQGRDPFTGCDQCASGNCYQTVEQQCQSYRCTPKE